ncbi:hypothetical protein Lepto7376_3491 [[Leptolyngbya] sp. PCC 7376]|uniref:hypothetical protein n=1 Tax=[Leptolyngbya] sp. PCC 7376 TaxID=111781 RepID=UPI00029F4182|nr:hypothetical protein [[Leptolyngbya] sp. PCC 7376]AFY39688.1 hypothetical protein Lepto7376_3491 [[Leptolyngbya] sp. PCC 7376]
MTSQLKGIESAFDSFLAKGEVTQLQSSTSFSRSRTQQTRYSARRSPKQTASDFSLSKVSSEVKYAQTEILDYFRDLTRTASLQTFLEYFEIFFINHEQNRVPRCLQDEIHCLLRYNSADAFLELLNNVCYVFIDGCFKRKKPNCIPELFTLINKETRCSSLATTSKRRVRNWLNTFRQSNEYQALTIFVPKHKSERQWGDRYQIFSLFSQRNQTSVVDEQYEAKQTLYRYLQNRYKFQLAMFLNKGDVSKTVAQSPANPTLLPATSLRLMHKFLNKQQNGFGQMAQDFLGRSLGKDYASFKMDLVDYLCLNVEGDRHLQWLPRKIRGYLLDLNTEKNSYQVGSHLLKKTCNATVDYFLNPENLKDPSHPFTVLMVQNEFLTLSVLLLKLILISPGSYAHLMLALNKLLAANLDMPQQSNSWLICFLETIRVVMTIGLQNSQWTANMQKLEQSAPSTQVA